MARSDPNSPEPSGKMLDSGKMRHSSGSGLEEEDRTIHSGHFMLSRVHDGENEEEDESFGPFSNDPRGFDFLEATKFPSRTYTFGPRSTQTLAIDASLTKLFECMTLAYSGKITSPKWKPFKGMPLSLKDKVRLNNIIWREWPMQYIYCRKPVVCQFATPVSDEVHTKPEAVVLEGKYWKRRLDTVTAEYKKWRNYYRERVLMRPPEVNISELASHDDLLERVREVIQALPRPTTTPTDVNLLTEEEFIMDFSDTLFTSLNQPFAFPDHRELSQSGYADMIQPGLMQLQPNLDDNCMDTFDPIQEMLVNNLRSQQSVGPTVFTGAKQTSQIGQQTTLAQGDASSLVNFGINTDLLNILGNAAHGSLQQQQQQQSQAFLNATLSQLASQIQLPNLNYPISQFNQIPAIDPASPVTPDTQMIIDPPESAAQYSPATPPAQNVPVHNNRKTTVTAAKAGNSRMRNRSGPATHTVGLGKPRPTTTGLPTHQAHTLGPGGKGISSVHSKPVPPSHIRSQAHVPHSGKPAALETTADKRDSSFAIPKGKSVPRKQRPIAPAPSAHLQTATTTTTSSTVAQKNTYLAQLLTTGNYPGGIKVKNEPAPPLGGCVGTSALGTLPQFRPITTSHPIQSNSPGATSITMQPIAPAVPSIAIVGDFPASVLIAAASQALGTTTVSVKDVVSIAHSSKSPNTAVSSSSSTLTQSLVSPSSLPSSPAANQSLGSPASLGSPPMTLSNDFSLTSSPSPSKDGSGMPAKSENHRAPHHELRKLSHISAEQKRRFNIKSGFDVIHAIIPSLSQNPNAKVSKAAMLQKTAEYCKKLKSERTQMQNEAEILKQEIESLNSAINVCQLQLPATGVPVTRQRADKMREMFEEYVKSRTLHNWKFWIFSIIIRSLFESYNSMVSTVSLDEMCRTALAWLDQHCSLVSLRPTVSNSLCHLSTTTSILSDPSQVPEQVTRAVTRQNSSDNPNQT